MGRRACLIALVLTATVLASDFAAQGIRAMDIAHLNIEYECFFQRTKDHIAIKGKFTNEA